MYSEILGTILLDLNCTERWVKLKPGYVEFGVVCTHSAIVVCMHLVIQLLLTRWVGYC